ncbi:hypothetical protein ACLB2K_025474 [Fragaria x ananassa]
MAVARREINVGCGFSPQREAIDMRDIEGNEGNEMRVEVIVLQLGLSFERWAFEQYCETYMLGGRETSSSQLQTRYPSGIQLPKFISHQLKSLRYLSDNHLKGTIPPSICQLQDMRILSLRNNQFSGEFPQEWSLWSYIDVVDISNNNLSGNIPSSMGIPSSLRVLKVKNNHFGGEIPSSLQNCSTLLDMDFSGNQLTGILPKWIGSELSKLEVLQLRFNFLSGNIPQQ